MTRVRVAFECGIEEHADTVLRHFQAGRTRAKRQDVGVVVLPCQAGIGGVVARRRPDIAMPVRDGLSAAEEISRDNLCAVVMVTAFSQRDVAMKAAEAGAVGYVVKPFTMADLEPSIALALARWRQIQDLQGQVEALGDRAKAREEVERAKAVLQERFGLSEPEAFSWLRKAAMDRRVTLSEAATALVSGQVTP